MTYSKLIAFYGTPSVAAAALGASRQRLNQWRLSDRIPLEAQIQYELLTGGKLRADLPLAFRRRNPATVRG